MADEPLFRGGPEYLQRLAALEAAYLRHRSVGSFGAYVRRLLHRFAAPGGLLIIGSYGNRTCGEPAAPVAAHLTRLGLTVRGSFAWVRAA